MTQPPNILIVDDEEHIRRIMSIMLGKHGYQCRTAASGEEALELVGQETFNAVFTDVRMPGLDGLELLARLKQIAPELVVVVVTAFASLDTAISAMKAGAYDYISKPFKEDEIVLVLEKALERGRLLDENRRLKKQIGERFDQKTFLGESLAMSRVFEKIAKVAETKATVLIYGESGTGKELAARSLHQNSPRRDKPFIPINCGAIPPNLMESELFGHTKGAFTGADRPKKGLIAESDGGTLFLDEISELPLEMQVKLLRVLQEEEVRRVGDNQIQKVDLRVVAATNKDLPKEIAEGRFREDLYYRLNVISLTLPPIRERPEDIPLLVKLFLDQAVTKHNLGEKRISPAAMKLLALEDWPGNVRALKNCVEQAALMSEDEVIGPGDLPFVAALVQAATPAPLQPVHGQPSGGNAAVQPLAPAVVSPVSPAGELVVVYVPEHMTDIKQVLKDVTEQAEKQVIERVLKLYNNNRTHTAEHLGLSRRALINKVQVYKLD